MRQEIQITVIGADGQRESLLVYPGMSLVSALELNGWTILSGTEESETDRWKVKVLEEDPQIPLNERKQLTLQEIEQKIRRADLYPVKKDIEVYLNASYVKRDPWQGLEWKKLSEHLPLIYKNIYLPGRQVNLPSALQEMHQALYDRIVAALTGYRIFLHPQDLKELAFLDRVGRPVIELKALANEQLKEVYALSRKERPIIGVILSLEAETITLILVDLMNGQKLDQYSAPNQVYQALSGASKRESSALKKEKMDLFDNLHQSLREQIQNMMDAFLEKHKQIRTQDIYRTVIMGQTVLLHIFMGIPPVDISRAGLHAIFYQEIQPSPQGQVPKMNPWGEYIVLQQWGHMMGSDALTTCLALYQETQAPVLILQATLRGQASLQVGKKIWVKGVFERVPDTSMLQSSIGSLLAAAGIRMEELEKVYVSVPFAQDISPLKEKIKVVFSRLSEEKIQYVGAPHFVGAQIALLSEVGREKLKEIQQKTVFCIDGMDFH